MGSTGRGCAVVAMMFAAATVVEAAAASWAREGNVSRRVDGGERVEIEWISQGSFRYSRCLGASCGERAVRPAAVEFELTEMAEGARFRTAYLTLEWRAGSRTMTVRAVRGGAVLFEELPHERWLLRRRLGEGERLYGLGPRTSAKLDLRGGRIAATHPLLISSAGSGMYVSLPASPAFDLGHSEKGELRVEGSGSQVEYFFYYGPSPKEILEEHMEVAGSVRPISASHVTVLPERFVPGYAHRVPAMAVSDTVQYLNHASMSGIGAPAMAAAGVDPAIASTLPLLYGLPVAGRRALLPYLFTYLEEARDRGIPMFRPMAMQYPKDAAAAEATGQYMLGDELLVAGAGKVYLPAGIWTEMGSNRVHPGRRSIAVEPGTWLARNGTILPLEAEDGRMVLHYFPRLGAEFFLSETAVDDISQIHAGPAGDQLRLEVESRVARRYEWVVHHVSEPVGVEPETAFRYDREKRMLHIEFSAGADTVKILNVNLRDPL